MNTSMALEQLDNARRSHIKWLNRAKSIIEGKSKVRDPHPLQSTACQFGLWFHSDGVKLFKRLNIEGEDTINLLHNALHSKYLLIYEIYFGSAEGIIYDSKVILTKKNISKEQKILSKKYLEDLRKLSYLLLTEIEKLQKHLENIED